MKVTATSRDTKNTQPIHKNYKPNFSKSFQHLLSSRCQHTKGKKIYIILLFSDKYQAKILEGHSKGTDKSIHLQEASEW